MPKKTTDDWRAVYRDWSFTTSLLTAVRRKVLGFGDPATLSDQDRQELAALPMLEAEVQRKKEAMDQCLQDVLARRLVNDPVAVNDPLFRAKPKPVRLAVASEAFGHGYTWVLMALYDDGNVVELDRGTTEFVRPEEARAAGHAFVPGHLR